MFVILPTLNTVVNSSFGKNEKSTMFVTLDKIKSSKKFGKKLKFFTFFSKQIKVASKKTEKIRIKKKAVF